ncbi:cysteine hydrolase family protein [Occultella aeris]|uniref:Vibriobactin-specific isochorismatase n=1 Tax=Occultella aeris TaxID=2761496 RepID=A0A7M4DRW3_9MICO|nr:isochorismatase family cysteine hydrolase [Occultella aeris]VZO40207.1 Vibriobactin-specific isochorismatase [Occultella aeris]
MTEHAGDTHDPRDTWLRPKMHGPTRNGMALLIIDMQNAYFENPALAAVLPALLEHANELIRAARAAGRPVILVRTVHARDRSTWTLNMLDDDEGFAFPGTEQAAYVEGLQVGDAADIGKTRDNAFHGTRLREVIVELGVRHLLIGGVSTHSCVAQTAMAAFAEDLHVAIAGDVIASENPYLSEAALTFLSEEMRQPVLDQDSCLELLRG